MRKTFIEESVAYFFTKYALVLAKFPLIFILVPLAITGISTYGCLTHFWHYANVRKLFTPEYAPSRYESAVFDEFQQSQNTSKVDFDIVIFMLGRNGAPVINNETRIFVQNLTNYIENDLKFKFKGEILDFKKVCANLSRCFHDHLPLFMELILEPEFQNNPNIKLGYPVSYFFNHKIFMIQSLLHPIYKNNSHEFSNFYVASMQYHFLSTPAEADFYEPMVNAFGHAVYRHVEKIK